MAALRDRFDQFLHPRRARSAAERLRRIDPKGVVFVCLGNICRSPFAKAVLEARGPNGLRVDSAGFIGPGRPPPEAALSAARSRGVDHFDHRSKVLTQDVADAADAIVVFDRTHVSLLKRHLRATSRHRVFWLGDFDPLWAGRRAILDPWDQPEAVFAETFERIERCVAAMVKALS